MPVSIDDIYQDAAKGLSEWRKSLLCTGLLYIDEEGFKVSPSPQNKSEAEFYKYKLDVLLRYSNDDPLYIMVVNALHEYIKDYEFHT